jgi:hypothetical protein
MKKIILLVFVLALGLATEIAKADFTFGTPTNLGPIVNSRFEDAGQSISVDGLTFYFSSNRSGGSGDWDLWVTRRSVATGNWGEPENLGSVINTSYLETSPCLSADGLSLFFCDGVWHLYNPRPGGMGKCDIWIARRQTPDDPWQTPDNLGPSINTSAHECDPSISIDSLSLFFDSDRAGGHGSQDLWIATRTSISDTWSAPTNPGSNVNSSAVDAFPSLSADSLTLFFMSNRTGNYDLWMTRRASIGEPWGPAQNLGPAFNSNDVDACPTISFDGSVLFFMSMRPGGIGGMRDLWQVKIDPIVDLNGDAIVDAADMCIIVDNWHTNNSLFDIAPMPFGDSVVDVQDLIALAEHLFEGAGLVAHWALDETNGNTACDAAGNIDAAVYNGQWTDGKVGGALLFNGLTTYMDCGDSLGLSTRQMTLAMWLEPQHMGGMRYVLSRTKEGSDDFDYVLMRHRYGEIEFAVAQEGSEPVSVMSNATTPLNEWTHVAVCLDGSEATIYINGQFDASAGYDQRISCDGCRLWISSLGGGTRFYNGKIDDVRIYNIALSAEEISALAN